MVAGQNNYSSVKNSVRFGFKPVRKKVSCFIFFEFSTVQIHLERGQSLFSYK